jgi:three-Cys-motif partner protein
MKKDHRTSTVGPWAAQKLDALEAYLRYYNTALKNKPFTRVYIDAFAGSPVSKVRGPEAPPEPSPFFDEAEDFEAQEQFIFGSPIRALNIESGFHRHYFFDRDKSRVKTLNELCETTESVTVKVGDCNLLIRDLAKSLRRRNIRGVAFLDPYGAHLEWETVEALAATGTMEVIINFPVAMAINRLITKSGNVPKKWDDQLTRCFGTEKWRDIAYDVDEDLFGQKITRKQGGVADRLLDLYMRRLRALFQYVATPRLIRNTRHAPLYYLIWAGPNKLGLKGADHILKQGEKVKKPR